MLMVLQRFPHTRMLGCPRTSSLALNWSCVCPCTSASAQSFLNTTFLERACLSSPMASRLFKAAGAGIAVPRPTLIASDRCCLRSSVSISTIFLGTTSPPSAPSHPDAFFASARSTEQGTISPYAFP